MNKYISIISLIMFIGGGRLSAQVISMGEYHTGAILADGTVKVWGRNNHGQLGQGNTTQIGDGGSEMGDNLSAVSLGSGRTATAIACGRYHTAVILDNGTVKVWGRNTYGQLGQGNNTTLGDDNNEMGNDLSAVSLGSGRTATAIACGDFHTAVILDNGTVKVWGYNAQGQLGQGNTTQIGDGGSEMGDDLSAVDLGSGRTATAIACGNYHTAVILDNGTVKVWGSNNYGQLGQGNTTQIGDDGSEMGNDLPAVNLGSGRTATAIAAGWYHTAVILDNGTVKVWGLNNYGQLGQGSTTTLGDNSSDMGDLSAVSLGTDRTATAIACGGYHTAVILDNGTVKVWGYNLYGQLGQGNTTTLGNDSDQMGNDLSAVSLGTDRTGDKLATGCSSSHTGVRLDNGTVKVWGLNDYGQLGQGNTTQIGDGGSEMGDNLPVVDLSSSSDATLPVELTSFNVLSTRSDAVILQWVTESEINNLGFILDRRVPGTEWTEIATYITHPELQGQGSVTHQTIYSYTDNTVLSAETYDYRLADVDYDGNKVYHSMTVMGVSPNDVVPETFTLYPAYPNPFNPVTTIRYDLPEDALVNITIYDMMGRIVKNLASSQQTAGYRSIQWNATNNAGSPVSAGLYLYTIQAGEFRQVRKMVLLK